MRPSLRYVSPIQAEGAGPITEPPLPITLDGLREYVGFPAAVPDAEVTGLAWQAVALVTGETGLRIRRGEYEATWYGFPGANTPLDLPGLNASVLQLTYTPIDDPTARTVLEPDMWRYIVIGKESRTKIAPTDFWPVLATQYGFVPTVFAKTHMGAEPDTCPDGIRSLIYAAARYIHDESEAGKMLMKEFARSWRA